MSATEQPPRAADVPEAIRAAVETHGNAEHNFGIVSAEGTGGMMGWENARTARIDARRNLYAAIAAALREAREQGAAEGTPTCPTCGYPMPGDECPACLNEMSEREVVWLRKELLWLTQGMEAAWSIISAVEGGNGLTGTAERWRDGHWEPMRNRMRMRDRVSEAEVSAALDAARAAEPVTREDGR